MSTQPPDPIGEAFQVLDEESKARRARNREKSAALLTELGIEFALRNDGAHLIVHGGTYDFWPGTGLWRERMPNGATGRGVRGLIKRIKGAEA